MRSRTWSIAASAVVLCLILGAEPSQADVLVGREALKHGLWQEAEKAFKESLLVQRGPANLGLARLYYQTGRYQEAASAALKASLGTTTAGPGQAMLAEIHLATGQRAEAVKLLQAATKADARNYRARLLLAQAYAKLGRDADARGIHQRLVASLEALAPEVRTPETLFVRAMALWSLEQWEEASGAFQDAVQVDERLVEANVQWARLFLQKYNEADAQQSLRDALKVNPNHPGALVLRGYLELVESNNATKANALADQALENNPRFVEAFLLKAQTALDNSERAEAEKFLDQALAVNPQHLEAHALYAAGRYLVDDLQAYDDWRQKALRLNPRYAEFYVIVGELAVRHHRYDEGVELGRQALAINPQHTAALSLTGTNLMRRGVPGEEDGLALIQLAFDRDPFNVRTFNTLNLYEEVIAKDYETVKSGDFLFRFNKKERPLLERYVPRSLDTAWKRYVDKYGFTPKTPISVELFTERQHYGARTIGVPELGAQGTCFGQLITAMSPSAAEADWEEVLWHELAHVFHLQLSRGRVGRWFSEGLAEYETNVARPYWKRERSGEIYDTLRDGTLWSIGELNAAFTRPGRRNGVLLAYQQSALVMHYLVETFGFPKIVEMLKLYSQGKTDAVVLKAATGKEIAELDAGFREYLRRALPHYAKGYRFTPPDDLEAAKKQAKAMPQDAAAQAQYAAGLYAADESGKAAEQARSALALDGKNATARMVLVRIAFDQGTPEGFTEARAELETILAAGVDGFDLRMRLAAIAQKQKDDPAFLKHLQAAKRWDPDSTEPYRLRIQYFDTNDRRDELLKETEGLFGLLEHDHDLARLLLDRYALDGRYEDVIRVAPRLIALTPQEYFVHAEYGRSLAKAKRPREAAYELESALLAKPRRPGKLRGLLARQYLLLGDKTKARAAAEQALKELPGERTATQVLRELDQK